jgi:hypothetical protein
VSRVCGAAAGVIAIAVLAACGASSSSTVARSQFASQLSTLCSRVNAAAQPASRSPAKFAGVIDRYVPKFQALTPPAALRPAYSEYVSLLQQLASALKSDAVAKVRQLVVQARTLTTQLGAVECGR